MLARNLGVAGRGMLWAAGSFVLLLAVTFSAAAQVETPDPVFGKLPMRFESNRGQTDSQVRFLARGPGYTLFLTPNEAVLSLRKFDAKAEKERLKPRARRPKGKYDHVISSVLRMRLVGANPQATVVAFNEMDGKVNYFIGNDPASWLSDIPVFGNVKYENVYSGVDLIYYGNRGTLEYDFIVAPAADPSAVTLEFNGPDKVELDADGNLIASLTGGTVLWRKPFAYQIVDGQRRAVAISYNLGKKNRFSFQVGDYDHQLPLIIDPALGYSTYLGATSDDSAYGIAVDGRGYVYVTGVTSSSDFPATGRLWALASAFVTKIAPGGSNVVFSTYLGGTKNTDSSAVDAGQAIAVDNVTNVYVVGYTGSAGFPTLGGYQTSYPSGAADAIFLTKFNPSGSILYSTFLGGANDQVGYGVAVDTNGNAFVAGETMSANFPVKSAFQPTYGGTTTNIVTPLDAVVAKFNTKVTGASSLVYSTYLGGNDDDAAQAIAIDSSGNAYVTGYSYSTNFPTTVSAIQTEITYFVDTILAKLGPTGSNLLYSTYFGGDDVESGQGIAVDTNRNIYVAGYTGSTNFPVTATAFQPKLGSGYQNGFVAMINPSLTGTNALAYSTYLGGNDADSAQAIAIDSNRLVYVAGYVGSTDFPISPGAFQKTFGGGFSDGFVAKLNPAASGKPSLIFSSYLGGGDDDQATAVAVDSTGNAYVAGYTVSTNFPTRPGALQGTPGGFYDAFITKIIPAADVSVNVTRSPNPLPVGGTLTYLIAVVNNGETVATVVALTNALPSQVAFQSVTATTGSCSQAGGVVTCSFGTMAANATATVSVVTTAASPGLASDVARITHGEADGNSANDAVTNITQIGSIVSVTATTSNAFETGGVQGTLRFTRTGYTASDVTVNYTLSGTATPDVDYVGLSGTITLTSGTTIRSVNMTPIDDAIAECLETVVATISPSASYAIGSTTNATVTISDNDLPSVNVTATTPQASEAGPMNGVFTVTRIGCTNVSLAVKYTVGGTASSGIDYSALSGTVTIPVGVLSQTVNVTPVNDTVPECPETVVFAISTNAAYVIGSSSNATVTIVDNDLPVVTVAATTPNASEAGTNGLFTITRNGCTASDLTVNFTFAGTATSGTDYNVAGLSATIAAGTTSTNVTIVPLADAVTEGSESAVLQMSPSASYSLGAASNATVNIADYVALPVAQFTGSPTIGAVPFVVAFTDGSVGSISNRTWDFGDGTVTNITTPSAGVAHIYTVGDTNTVTLTVNGPLGNNSQTRTSYIVAIDIPPQQSVTPSSRAYGTWIIGQTNIQTFLVINTGGGFLNGAAVAPAPFAVVAGSPYSLTSGQTSTVGIAFIPTLPGSFNANVIFSSNGGSSSNAVTGTGLTPGQLGVNPASLNFGFVTTGATVQATLVVTNLGGAAVSNGTASVTGGPFAIVSGSSFSLAGFGKTNVVVSFTPPNTSSFTSAVIIASANGGSLTDVVTGAGSVLAQAAFTATPTNGVVPLLVGFTDTSTGTITNRFWNFGDGTTFNTNATSLTHTYSANGAYTVSLIVSGPIGISTNTKPSLIRAFNPPQQIITPTSRDFGAVTIGKTNTLSFSVINTGDLSLTGTATTTGPYTVTNGTSYTVLGGQTGTVTVSFIPVTPGTFNNNIIFNSNGGTSTNSLSGIGLTAGQIAVSPATLNFGIVATSGATQAVFTVTNTGGSVVTNGTASAVGGPFTVVSGVPFSLPPGGSTNVIVQFAPVAVGAFTNSVAFSTANGGNSTNTVIGTGALRPTATFSATPTNGVAPLTVTFTDNSTGAITSRSWSFGDGGTLNTTSTSVQHTYTVGSTNTVRLIVTGPVGANTNTQTNLIRVLNPPQLSVSPVSRDFGTVAIGQSNALTFAVSNTGDVTLNGTAASSAPYTVTGGSPYTIPPGQSVNVSVSFAPGGTGTFNAKVVLTSDGGSSTNAVTGVGVTQGQIGVSPASLDFGTIATGATSQLVFTVTNSGGTSVTNGTAAVTGGPYSVVAGATFSVAPGGATNVTVRFAPVAAGGFINNVIFNTSNGGSSTNPLTGTGAITPAAVFTATPTNGPVPLTVTFTDSSTGTIANRSWSFGDGGTLATTSTNVQYTYTVAATNTVRLIVSGPVGASTNTQVNLIRAINPPQLNVTPSGRDFGSVTIGQTNSLTFSVVNTGDQNLTGTAAAPLPFAVSSGSSYLVLPGRTGTVTVTFAPVASGPFNADVIFASNGGASTNAVAGTGLTPGQIGVSPAGLSFGTLIAGTTSQRVFTVTNSGGTPVSNGVASVGGSYSIVAGATFSVAAGGATNVTVRFAPVTAGGFTNNVIFTTANGGNSTNLVTGSSAIVPAADFTATPTNGTTPLVVTFNDLSTGTINTRTWSFGDGGTLTTASTSFTHTYANPGTNTVRLIVTGPVGVSTNSQPNLIVAVRPPQQVIVPANQDYGAVTIGETNTQTFLVINTGDLALNGSTSVNPPFEVGVGSPYSVDPGQTGIVEVSFIPTASGTFIDNVVFSSNGGVSTNEVAGTGLTPGQLGVSPVALNFGAVVVGSTSQRVFSVSNSGGTDVTNGTAAVTNGPFAILSGATFDVPAGGSTNVIVEFAPIAAGSFTNSVIFTSDNGGDSTNNIIGVAGVVPSASFTAAPTSGVVSFNVTFDDTSTGTITNRMWSFGDGATTNTTSTNVVHTYSAAGTNTVRLIVSGPVGISTSTVADLIVGINPAELDVTPTSLDFGAVTIGLSNTLTFSLINVGDVTLNGTAAAAAPFAVTSGSPYTIAPHQTGTVTVTFTPSFAGTFNASMTFASDGGVSTNAVTGAGRTPGQLGVNPIGLDFGAIATGTTSQRVFVVTNSGGTTVSNGIASVTGGPYMILSGSPLSLTAGASTNVVVQFAPVAVGGFTNNFVVTSANGGSTTNPVTGSGAIVPSANFSAAPTNGVVAFNVNFTDTSTGTIVNRAWNFGDGVTTNTTSTNVVHTYSVAGTNTVRLIVTGPVGVSTNSKANLIVGINPAQLAVTPASRNFGSLTIGLTNTLTFSVINPGDVTLSGTAAVGAPFAVTGGSPYTVAPHQTGTVTVIFAPNFAGAFNQNVAFASTGGASTNAVNGVGLTPGQIVATPSALDYGTIATGTISQRVFIVTNAGGTTVTNGQATVTGGPFAVMAGTPFSLMGGASTNVAVQFAPVAAGDFASSVVFTSANGSSATNTVAGSGAIVPVASFSATPTNGPVPLAVTYTDSSTGTITNRSWSFGDGATLTTNATSVTHTYTVAGNYTVRLIATGPVGASTNTQSGLVVALDPAQLATTPASLNFGAVTIGLSNTLTFSVINVGDLPLTGSAIAGAPFAVVSGSPFTVGGGKTGTVSVSFAPIIAGGFNDDVIFTSNGGSTTNTVTGVGLTPGQISVTPAALDYDVIPTGTTSQRVFIVSNLGGTTVSNGTATVTGGPFAVLSGNTFSLVGGSSTNVVVRFAPVAVGNFTNAVIFTSANGGNSTNALTGSGAIVPNANFNASPTFGAVPFAVTFNDTSTGTLTNRFWSFGDGVTTNTTATSLTHTYDVAGTNTVQLIASGPLGSSTNNKPNLIVAVNPPHLVVDPTGLDFGAITIGLTNTLTMAVINTGDLPLNGTATVGAPFTLLSGSPYSVAAGQTGTITVSFRPVIAGAYNDNVVFASNGGGSTNPVSGVGLTPGRLVVSPPIFDYGTIAVNTSQQGVLTVNNAGGTTVSNGAAVVTGGPFTVVSGSSFDLTAGASVSVIVSFTPSAVGAFTNEVIITSANGGNSTNGLIGGAAFIPVANFTAAPTAGLLPLTVAFTDASTGTISGRQWSFGDGTTSTSTSPSHTYTSSGNFTVSLSAFGPAGTNTNTKANLITVVDPNLFVKMAGSFYGLSTGSPPTFASSGYVVFKLSSSGVFKATYTQGKTRTTFGGQFDQLGNTTATVVRAGLSMLTMALHLDGNGSDQITGSVSDGSFNASLAANRALVGPAASPQAGKRFTLLLPADTTNTTQSVPLGDGFGTVLTKAPGSVTLSGYTGDGQKIKQKSYLSKFGTWPMYVPLYNGLGAMFGWVTHTNVVGVSDFEAAVHWHKPAIPGAFYPAGFADDIFMLGATYVPPLSGQRVLTLSNGLDNAQVTIGDGNVSPPIVVLVSISTANGVTSTNLTMKIIPPTGLFNGKFTHPVTHGSVPFRGAVLQKQNFGTGFFLGVDQCGFINLEPAP